MVRHFVAIISLTSTAEAQGTQSRSIAVISPRSWRRCGILFYRGDAKDAEDIDQLNQTPSFRHVVSRNLQQAADELTDATLPQVKDPEIVMLILNRVQHDGFSIRMTVIYSSLASALQ